MIWVHRGQTGLSVLALALLLGLALLWWRRARRRRARAS
jgi:nitrate reductase gamma subunit